MKAGRRDMTEGRGRGGYRVAVSAAYAFWVAFVLLLASSHLMADMTRQGEGDEFSYSLVFPADGRTGHYTVDRADANEVATIEVTYVKSSHTLLLELDNVKNITVHTLDLFLDEGPEILGVEPDELGEEMYKDYFLERNLFNLNIETSYPLEVVTIEDILEAEKVFIDDLDADLQEDIGYEYYRDDVIITSIPEGTTNVDIYFDYKAYDLDEDGLFDDVDDDDDGDGYLDDDEVAAGSDPRDPSDRPADMDNDNIPDVVDKDIDGDGTPNNNDAFPEDKNEVADFDGDGIGDNADDDDDNDGVLDAVDPNPFDATVGPTVEGGDDGDDEGDMTMMLIIVVVVVVVVVLLLVMMMMKKKKPKTVAMPPISSPPASVPAPEPAPVPTTMPAPAQGPEPVVEEEAYDEEIPEVEAEMEPVAEYDEEVETVEEEGGDVPEEEDTGGEGGGAMSCPECGAEIPEGFIACPDCGEPVGLDEEEDAALEAELEAEMEAELDEDVDMPEEEPEPEADEEDTSPKRKPVLKIKR